MANFAKAQLLKYGWTEGKGLGKTESGISEPLKPKLKFDTAGIGHDRAEQFTYHWWEKVFDDAANNIKVDSSTEDFTMGVIDQDTVDITTKKSSITSLKKNHALEYGSFIKTSTLLEDGKLIPEHQEKPTTHSAKVNFVNLTDEELFAACGGRTAHKGARHGLTLNGKLARIAEQEKLLLEKRNQNKEKRENGENHEPVVEEDDGFRIVKHKKKSRTKRKKLKAEVESMTDEEKIALAEDSRETTEPQPSCSYAVQGSGCETTKSRKKSFRKNNEEPIASSVKPALDDNANTIEVADEEEEEEEEDHVSPRPVQESSKPKKSHKSRQRERKKINALSQRLGDACVIDETEERVKKRKREVAETTTGVSVKKKCRKMALEEAECGHANRAEKRNEKISRKKEKRRVKKLAEKMDNITLNLMLVNLKTSEGESSSRKSSEKRKSDKTVSEKSERKKCRVARKEMYDSSFQST